MRPQDKTLLVSTSRYYRLSAQQAVRDAFDALVELITNSDDSYHRLGDADGAILIEVEHRRGEPSRLVVHDRAEGMDLEEMRLKIGSIGEYTARHGDRSFMGRGAKDCAALGDMVFESIKNDWYYKCEVQHSGHYLPWAPPEKANAEVRRRLRIPRGNGLTVTLNFRQPLPRPDSIRSSLPYHYALRDILDHKTGRKVYLRDLNSENLRPELLSIYNEPTGEVLLDEQLEIPCYPDAKARLVIKRARERLLRTADTRFLRAGFIVKGERAIHEVTFFANEIANDPVAEHYFGRLECRYIDHLCRNYDSGDAEGKTTAVSNPRLLVDPSRREGLVKDHPFAKALYEVAGLQVRRLIENEKAKEATSMRVESEQTTRRLSKLARKVGQFFEDRVEELSLPDTGEQSLGNWLRLGIRVIPGSYVLALGQERQFSLQVVDDGQELFPSARVWCEDNAIEVLHPSVHLSLGRQPRVLVGSFTLRGKALTDFALVRIKVGERETTVRLRVQANAPEHPTPSCETLSFEKPAYVVKFGKHRRLVLWAPSGDTSLDGVPVEVISSHPNLVVMRPQPRMALDSRNAVYTAIVHVQGREIDITAQLVARAAGETATTTVKVVSEKEGVPFEFKLMNEEYGFSRAKWNKPHSPNQLLIAARHPSVRRYLGPGPDFAGQHTAHFRLLLAEIVAENVVFRLLEAEEKANPVAFQDLGVDGFYSNHNRHMRDLLPIAHEAMVTNADLKASESSSQGGGSRSS